MITKSFHLEFRKIKKELGGNNANNLYYRFNSFDFFKKDENKSKLTNTN